jgi:hypothetical protein
VPARPRLAVSGSPQRPPVKVEQRSRAQVNLEHDVTAVTTIASVRPAQRLVFLAVHRSTPVAAVAGLNPKLSLISELSHQNLVRRCLRSVS